MKKYLLGVMFLLSSFFFAKPTTVSEALEELNNPTITKLNLNFFSDPIGDEGARALGGAIKKNTTITNLALDIPGRNQISAEGAQALGDAIGQNATITTLFLGLTGNQVGDAGAQALGGAIGQNTTIKNLNLILVQNRVGTEGAQALACAIEQNTTITNLNLVLVRNRVGTEGAQALARAIEQNTTITNLNLNLVRNRVGTEGVQALSNAIENNTTITNLNLHFNDNLISNEEMQNVQNIINRTLERNKQFATFEKYFLKLFITGEFSDAEILGYPVYSTIISARLGNNAADRLQNVLRGRGRNIVKPFLAWVYTGFVKTDDEQKIKDICDELNIDFENKNGIAGFRRDIKSLYDSRLLTGDFTIVVEKVDNKGILSETIVRVHKIILAARSNMFRNMFLGATDTSNRVTDLSGLSLPAMDALIEFIYTGQISNLRNLGQDVKDELLEAAEFYQLPQGELEKYLN